MDKRVTKDEKEDQDELHKISKLLDLDNNYTLKFGLLKKACVLFFPDLLDHCRNPFRGSHKIQAGGQSAKHVRHSVEAF